MTIGAKITSIGALREFRLVVAKYRSEATAALIEAESELQRTVVWLRHDRLAHWTRELRKREELLVRAKSEMYRNVVQSDTDGRAGVDQKKALEKAKRQLAEAQQKLEAVKKWIRVLDHEMVLYRGEVQSLNGMLESDLVQAEARLERMAHNLDEYAQLVSPDGGGPAPDVEAPATAVPPSDSPSPSAPASPADRKPENS